MTPKETNQIAEAILELAEAIRELSYQFQGQGGHTLGDSMEGIMMKMLNEKKDN